MINNSTIMTEKTISITKLIFFCKTVKITMSIIITKPAMMTNLFINSEKHWTAIKKIIEMTIAMMALMKMDFIWLKKMYFYDIPISSKSFCFKLISFGVQKYPIPAVYNFMHTILKFIFVVRYRKILIIVKETTYPFGGNALQRFICWLRALRNTYSIFLHITRLYCLWKACKINIWIILKIHTTNSPISVWGKACFNIMILIIEYIPLLNRAAVNINSMIVKEIPM